MVRDAATVGPGPLLIDIHGGPHSACGPHLESARNYQQELAARGWTILLVDPPASDGYGEDYYTTNIGKWGFGDQEHFMGAIDALIAEGLADPNRLAVTGYSYGGYATCWLTANSDRFAAAIAGGVVSDTPSIAASDLGYPELCRELGGTPWEDPEVLLAQSPMRSVTAVNTPTLILHGDSDERCPVNQAEMWFAALRARKVPTELVLYPDADHLFIITGKPSHRRDYARRLIAWLEQYVPG